MMEYRTGLNFELAANMGPISRLAARRRSRFSQGSLSSGGQLREALNERPKINPRGESRGF